MSLSLYKLHSDPESLHGFDEIMNSVPDMAWEHYMGNHEELRKREYVWAKSPLYSFLYARDVLKGRFPEGEDSIATVAEWSYKYAKDAIKKRFPKGEDIIAKEVDYASLYAFYILRGERVEKIEDAIAKDPYESYQYARDVIRQRFPKGEPAIRGSEWQGQYEFKFGVKL